MTVKQCSCCKKQLTTKDVYSIGRNEIGLWINCKHCKSTLLLKPKKQVTLEKAG
jgi:DNA-directed RNA polymerase subunit RPC12/RpoP